MTDRIGLSHEFYGKGDLHAVSSALTAQHLLRTHNSAMRRKKAHAHMDELSTFAARLQHAMDHKGVNANQIEVQTGDITRQAVGAMLKGLTEKPTWDKLVLLSNFLGVRPEWLAEGEMPMVRPPVLKDEEVTLIDHYRHMSPTHQKDLRDIAERWSEENDHSERGSSHMHRTPRRQ